MRKFAVALVVLGVITCGNLMLADSVGLSDNDAWIYKSIVSDDGNTVHGMIINSGGTLNIGGTTIPVFGGIIKVIDGSFIEYGIRAPVDFDVSGDGQDICVATLFNGLVIISDYGNNWRTVDWPEEGGAIFVSLNNDAVYAAMFSGNLWRLKDKESSSTWEKVSENITVNSNALWISDDGMTIYSANERYNGFKVSRDAGKTWTNYLGENDGRYTCFSIKVEKVSGGNKICAVFNALPAYHYNIIALGTDDGNKIDFEHKLKFDDATDTTESQREQGEYNNVVDAECIGGHVYLLTTVGLYTAEIPEASSQDEVDIDWKRIEDFHAGVNSSQCSITKDKAGEHLFLSTCGRGIYEFTPSAPLGERWTQLIKYSLM